MNNGIEVLVEICRDDVVLPVYAKEGDAGMDICAAVSTVIAPGQTVIIPTGLKFVVPKGYEVQVRPRSGISLKTPLRVPNSPGTIDSGYRDEVGIIMSNTSDPSGPLENELIFISSKDNLKGSYQIMKGDRIAQIVLQEVPKMKLTVVDSVSGIGEDRGGGFGHTGV
jgi:dUTP pyrophosphatase